MKYLQLCFLLLISSIGFGQTDINVWGTAFNIQENAELYISGDLVINGSSPTGDPTTRNTGIIRLGGDLINNSPTPMFLNEGIPGPVIFVGDGRQEITGNDLYTDLLYIPAIYLDKVSGDLYLLKNLVVDTINFEDAAAGNIVFGDQFIELDENGVIRNESATSKLVLENGYIRSATRTLTNIQTIADERNFTLDNLFGTGFGISSNSETLQGEAGGDPLKIFRYESFDSPTQVANGTTSSRFYRLEFFDEDIGSPDPLNEFLFNYFDDEIPGEILPTSELALYVSNDNGNSWTKIDGSFEGVAPDGILRVSDVPVRGLSGGAGNINWFTIAERDCDIGIMPISTSVRTNALLDNSNEIYQVHVCDGTQLDLQFSPQPDTEYSWWFESTLQEENTLISIPAVSEDHEGIYTVLLKNTKGCETFRDVYVNVWSPPQWNGGVEDFYSSNPDNVCAGRPVTFDVDINEDFDNDTGLTDRIVYYEWSFQDENETKFAIDINAGDVFENPVFTYENPGDYDVTLYVETQFGCSMSFNDQITIHPNPNSDFVMTDERGGETVDMVCSGENFFLDPDPSILDLNGSTFLPYLTWNFGDGSPEVELDPTLFDPSDPSVRETYGEIYHHYDVTEDATYTVSLTVTTLAGCSVVSTKEIQVFPQPDASFTMEYEGSLVTETCVGYPITFRSVQAQDDESLYSYRWAFNGVGDFSSDGEITVVFDNDEEIDVSLTVLRKTTNCETESAIQTLDIIDSPTPPAYGPSVVACSSTEILDAAYSGTASPIPQLPGITYRWLDEDDNLLATTQTYEVDAINGSEQNITLEIRNITGCITSRTIAVTLNGDFEIDLGPDVIACESAEIGRNEFPGASYAWTRAGDPAFSSIGPTLDVTVSDTYTVTVTGEGDCNGNVATDDIVVTINAAPSITLPDNLEICSGELLTLDAGSHDSYEWSDGSIGSTLTVSTPGLYWVVVTDNGCSSAREEVLVELRDEELCNPACLGTVDGSFRMEVGGITTNEACVLTNIHFISSAAELDFTAYDFAWDFGDGSTSSEPFPVRSYTNVELLNVSLLVTSKVDGCDAYSFDNMNVVAAPEAPAYGSNNTFCSATGILDAAFNGANPSIPQLPGTIYRWLDEDDNLLATTQTYEVDAINGNEQNITLEIENLTGCVTSLPIAVTLNGNLEIDLGPDVMECERATIGKNEFPGASYTWTRVGDPTFSSTDPIIDVTISGTYTVTVTDNVGACAGGTTSDDIVVTINTTPSITLGEDRQICSGELLTLNAGFHDSYLWSDGSNGSSLTVSTTGEYWVQVTSVNGCSNSDTIVVEFREDEISSPSGEIISCDPGCIGAVDASFEIEGISLLNEVCAQTELIFISAASNIDASRYDYFWTFGDGSISTDPTPVKQYDQLGSTSVSLTVTSKVDGCSATTIDNFTVLETPAIPLGETVTSCSSNITLDAENPGANYIWRDPVTNDILSTERLFDLTSDSELPINLYLEVSSVGGCITSQSISVRLNTELIIDLGPDIVACESAILGSDEFPSATYLWSTGETTPTIVVTRSGPYAVRVTEPENDCISEDVINVQIEDLPNPDLGGDLSLCVGEVQSVTPGNFSTYLWSNGSTESSLLIGSPGTYWVEVSNELGCINRDTILVSVNESNPLDLPDETRLCNSAGVTIDAGLTAQNYTWGSSNGFESSEQIITVTDPGTYWLEVQLEGGCVHRDTVTVTESTDQLDPSFLIPSVVGVGDLVNIVQLTDPLPESSVWIFGDGTFSTEHNPIHQYFRTGEYTITLRITNGGCETSISKTINVVESRFEEQQVTQQLIEIIKLKTYPNPIVDKFNLEVEVSTEAPILVRVFTMTGREVYRNAFEEKELSVPIDLSNQIAGLYLVNIEIGSESRLIKIIKPK